MIYVPTGIVLFLVGLLLVGVVSSMSYEVLMDTSKNMVGNVCLVGLDYLLGRDRRGVHMIFVGMEEWMIIPFYSQDKACILMAYDCDL